MDAIVLAGGYATRLWPITRNRPKMLLPVGEETIIDGILSDLEADDRISDVYISTNEYFADEFQAHIDESDLEKPQLSIEQTTNEDSKFGVVGALAQLIDREGIEDDMLVVAGDNLIGFDIGEFASFFEETGTPCIAAYDVGSKERATSYGVVDLDGTEVVGFQEKPDNPKSTLCSIACYAFPSDTLPLFDEYLSEDNNPDEPGWLMQWLAERDAVNAFTFDSYWYDVGEADAYIEAVQWALGDESIVADSATVTNSKLGENVHVMADATITNATLEDTVVFPGATVEDAAVEWSLVDRESRVSDVDLSGALIGEHSKVK